MVFHDRWSPPRIRLTTDFRGLRSRLQGKEVVLVTRSPCGTQREAGFFRGFRLSNLPSTPQISTFRRTNVSQDGQWKSVVGVDMKSLHLFTSEPIAIFAFLQKCRRDFDILRIHEGSAMWVLTQFMRDSARATLQIRMAREVLKTPRSLTTYCQVINNLLSTYAADDIVSQAESKVPRCAQT